MIQPKEEHTGAVYMGTSKMLLKGPSAKKKSSRKGKKPRVQWNSHGIRRREEKTLSESLAGRKTT